jgi:C4-dicarboxylate-specific signal transduction histidine kinase
MPLFVKTPGADHGVHISSSGAPVRDDQGQIIGAVVSIIDMTPIRASQAELTEHQQMLAFSSRMSEVGEIAGAIAHEINTPLATLSLILESVKEQLVQLPSAELTSKVNAKIDMGTKLTARIAKIVKSLRAVCRAGNREPFTTCTVDQILTDTEELISEKVKTLGITLTIKKDIGQDASVECRPVQLMQVLLNLLNNACHAIQNLDEKWIEVAVTQNDNAIEFRVTDSGQGIPDDVQAKLFTPFFSTKVNGQGGGIGLNVSRRIISAHQGSIDLNKENKNTQFVFTIPLIQTVLEKNAA